jgi:hypothetical protein
MAINPELLIAAPMLQDYLVDKDTGLPLAGGVITLYSETNRLLLKDWYTQQGTNPPYTYVPLPNPLTLSAVGTIQDISGNDVIPYYYPYEADNTTFDSYYITVYSAAGELQFTRSNFPFVAQINPATTVATNQSLVTNSVFWRNISAGVNTTVNSILNNTISLNGSDIFYATIAPDQHDGFTMPDILYFKDVKDGSETINFQNFVGNYPDNSLGTSPVPQYYLDIDGTTPGTSTQRFIQIPLDSSVFNLSGFPATTFSLQAIDVLNTGTTTLGLGVLQYLGTGINSNPVNYKTTVLGPSWKQITANLPIPTAPLTISSAGDSGLYLRINLPTTAFHIRIALPSFYLNDSTPTNSFQTNDQVNAIISSPRTGDVRISNNSFYPFGWTPMNDGVIALNTPTNLQISRINQDTWQLYNLLWNLSQPYTNGTANPICQLFSNTGTAVTYGSSAYADFTTNNTALQLTKLMGKVLLGTVPFATLINSYTHSFTAVTVGGVLSISTTPLIMNLFTGMPIKFTGGGLPATLVANRLYFVCQFNYDSAGSFTVCPTFADAIAITNRILFAAGSGTVSSALTGSSEGEYSHLQSTAEVGIHSHLFSSTPGTGGAVIFPAPNNHPFQINLSGGGNTGNTVALSNTVATPAPLAFNITQPGTFANIFIKL